MKRYRKDYSNEEQELDELNNQSDQNGGDSPEDNPEEKTFKQRYGDLRRHSQSQEKHLNSEIDRLQKELAKANQAKKEYPKTEKDVEGWRDQYPDLYGIVKTIILRELDESNGNDESTDRIRELEEKVKRNDIDRQRDLALKQILEAHPDFNQLIDESTSKGKALHAWVEKQAQWVQYSLYENETDAQSAIDAVDLYKSRNQADTTEERKKSATSVRSKPVDAPRGERQVRYSESSVDAMSPKEFEKHSEAIEQAIRDGEFDYDISGQQ